ncbi:hypothetical protein CF386_03180 [Paraphotobacterium marinum]|uniref:Oligosaccharide repeat unit polymerase n=1 Tax=Paraphotobacterium marinum TaxID=1755811 RepID=A0A220VCH2_9GAMM|nr:O-antigen polymerase [Paraphotobacterium marinum]ASK78108.1 hypothetical protein CF386_03180 [Paraphotobacterium marinum]
MSLYQNQVITIKCLRIINVLAFLLLLVATTFSFYDDESVSITQILCVDVIIVWLYFIDKPKQIFHPNNIVFIFHFLYVVVPSLIFFIFQAYDIQYTLPWAPPNWLSFHPILFVQILYVYLILFLSFSYFTRNMKVTNFPSYQISTVLFCCVILVMIAFLSLFIIQTGGILAWVTDYKTTYLTGRKGVGGLSFIIRYLSPLVAFMLGLYLRQFKQKFIPFLLGVLFLLFLSYFQGFKSTFIIFLVMMISPWLYKIEITNTKIFVMGLLFFLFLGFANYLRSDGLYNSFQTSIEYLMSYFNVFYLQDIVLNNYEPQFMQTIGLFLNKYAAIMGGGNPNANFDLSVMLTKVYFPGQWESWGATQQWPLVTDLYFNWYGMLFGWIPLIIYAAIISKLYKLFIDCNLYFWPIYIFLFFRIFSTLRSTVIPWDIIVMIVFFFLFYLSMKVIYYVKK